MAHYGYDRVDDIVTVWSTDLRRSPRKIAERALAEGETLAPIPRDYDDPGRPTRFRIVKEA